MQLLLIGISLLSVYFSYYLGDILLQYYYVPYKRLQYHRQKYVVKNFIKGIYLSFFTLFATVIIKDALWHGIWYNNAVHTLGILYCLPDLMGLLRVPKLHRNTIFHHVTVCILSTINTFNDYENQDTIWKGVVIYAYVSSLTGIVNHYLAYRLVCDNTKEYRNRKYLLALCAYNIYALSLAINWTYQIYTIVRWVYKIILTFVSQIIIQSSQFKLLTDLWMTNKLGSLEYVNQLINPCISVASHVVIPLTVLFVYLGLLYFIVIDDIILVKFLKKEIVKHKFTTNVTNVTNVTTKKEVIKEALHKRGISSEIR